MIYFLAIALPVLLVGCGVYCMFFCQACEERRREQRQTEIQLKAGREVNALLRAERALEKAEKAAQEIELMIIKKEVKDAHVD